jgi:hypothetical protein
LRPSAAFVRGCHNGRKFSVGQACGKSTQLTS